MTDSAMFWLLGSTGGPIDFLNAVPQGLILWLIVAWPGYKTITIEFNGTFIMNIEPKNPKDGSQNIDG